MGHDLVRAMRSQLKRPKSSDVEALVKCPMSEDDYIKLLIATKVIGS